MALNLHTLKPASGSQKKAKKVGRGGKRGTYSGRGIKGQKARSGGKGGLKRRGLRQLMERTHKVKGFKSIFAKPAIVSLGVLSKTFKDGDNVTPKSLIKKKIVENIDNGVKILSTGKIKIKLNLEGIYASKKAKQTIEAVGGKVIEPVKQTKKVREVKNEEKLATEFKKEETK